MILHYSPRSPFVRKVMVVLHETGQLDRVEKVRSVTSMLRPNLPLMQYNPWSKIPTLVTDDGQVLLDSDVIMEYLDSLHAGAKLHPPAGDARWQALRWRAFGNEYLHALILWRNERERQPERQLPELIAAFQLKIRTGLAMLETEVGALHSAPLSVGHVALACAIGYMGQRFEDFAWRESQPRLAAWFDEFRARPSMLATEPFDDLPRYNAAGERL
jgi:glutathione S-transferase